MVKVKLYDSHPGFGGAVIPLPPKIKELADSLDGEIIDLEEAVKNLEDSVRAVEFEHYKTAGKIYEIVNSEEHNFIGFSIKRGQTEHFFRLIRYEEINHEEKEKKLEKIFQKKKEKERTIREETEKDVRKKLNNYETPKSIDELPVFTGWTPSFTLEYFGFRQEYDIDLVNIRKVKKIKDISPKLPEIDPEYIAEKLGAEIVNKNKPSSIHLVGKSGVREVTTKELEYGKQHAGSKYLFESKREEIQQAFDDLNQREVDFVAYRTYRGWPAVWDSVEFYSKPEELPKQED